MKSISELKQENDALCALVAAGEARERALEAKLAASEAETERLR